VLVTVNTSYKIFEAEYLLRQSDTHTVFFSQGVKDSDYVSIIRELLPEIKETGSSLNLNPARLPRLRNAVFIPHDPSSPLPEGIDVWGEVMKLGDKISDAELDAVQRTVGPHDVTNMQYTSGTTGFPKGVMLTHYNILNNGKTIGDGLGLTPKDRFCISVPFFHCFGLVLSIMASITHATTMVPVDVFSAATVLDTLQKEKCTAVNGVPSMFIFMLEHPEFSSFDLSSLRTGIMAGSPCPIKVMEQVIKALKKEL
jgi:fatty-acyl-CoA synthase